MKRLASVAALVLLAGCGGGGGGIDNGNSNYNQFYQIVGQSVKTMFGNVRITREQAAAIPYASMGYRLNGGNQGLVVLATDTGSELLWTAATHIVFVTRDGRIIRTVGLDHDLTGLTQGSAATPPSPAAARKAPFTTTRLEDFKDIGLYGVTVTCRAAVKARQTIRILGQAIATTRVDESCESRVPSWSFVDSYWVDNESGLVWRSVQHIHPKGGEVETEILRPPG